MPPQSPSPLMAKPSAPLGSCVHPLTRHPCSHPLKSLVSDRPSPPRSCQGLSLAAFGCLIGMHFAVRKSVELTVGLLGAFGLLIGLAVAPTLVYYANTNPQALWQAGGATALFIAGFGAVGYSTKRDLSVLGRVGSWALIGLIGFGVVLIFVQIPNGALIYSILGLVIYAGLTLYDFQRLRGTTETETDSAPLLAASIFLDILNVFLFFLQIFARPGEN
ncbi:Bax inhibitor-1 family protein [Kribbella sp. NPDC049174]|uniref:Bax inhibitor-1/YccA family protein n=1 Tax=Kribbella sp. NPDC049174 TaxID=3364112 RepID=UPI0037176751